MEVHDSTVDRGDAKPRKTSCAGERPRVMWLAWAGMSQRPPASLTAEPITSGPCLSSVKRLFDMEAPKQWGILVGKRRGEEATVSWFSSSAIVRRR